MDEHLEQNQHPCNLFHACLTWLFSWWPRAFPLLVVRTLSRAGQAPQEDLLHLSSTRRKQANRSCYSVRQEAGTGRSSRSIRCRTPTKECSQWPPYRALYRSTTLGGKPQSTFPGDTRKSQHSHVPALGDMFRSNLQEPSLPCMSHSSVTNQDVPGAGSPLHVLRDIFTTHRLLPTATWSLKLSFKYYRTQ